MDFRDSRHLGFPIRTTFAIFDLQVTSILPMKFWVNRPFGSGEKFQTRFSKWPLGWPSWFNYRNNFNYFSIYKSPQYFLSSFKSICLSTPEKKFKIDFQDGTCGSHLGFPIGTIFDLQVIKILPTKFQVILALKMKCKIDFQAGGHGGHLWFPIRII